MAWHLSDLDTIHFDTAGPVFTDGTYVFLSDPGTGVGQVVVYKIVNGLLTYLFSEVISFITDLYFDGTYLACTMMYQIRIYSFSESGLTFVDEAFNPIPGPYSSFFFKVIKDESETEDIWHVTYYPQGLQTFKLTGGSLTSVAFMNTYYMAFGIRSANNVLYMGFNSTYNTLSIYEFTGSSYNLLNGINLSDGIMGLDNIDNKIWTVFGGSGAVRLFEHNLTDNTLTELDIITKGTCTNVNTNSTTCFASNLAGNYGFEYIDGSIVEVETDDTGISSYYVSSTDSWVVFSGEGGLYLYELSTVPPIPPIPAPPIIDGKVTISQRNPDNYFNLIEKEFPFYDTVSSEVFFGLTGVQENIVQYDWDFGDGSESALREPPHIYNTYGHHSVIALVKDYGVTWYQVGDDDNRVILGKMGIGASPRRGDKPLNVSFTNESISPTGSQYTGWQWDYGDGYGATGMIGQQHTYVDYGSYTVGIDADFESD